MSAAPTLEHLDALGRLGAEALAAEAYDFAECVWDLQERFARRCEVVDGVTVVHHRGRFDAGEWPAEAVGGLEWQAEQVALHLQALGHDDDASALYDELTRHGYGVSTDEHLAERLRVALRLLQLLEDQDEAIRHQVDDQLGLDASTLEGIAAAMLADHDPTEARPRELGPPPPGRHHTSAPTHGPPPVPRGGRSRPSASEEWSQAAAT